MFAACALRSEKAAKITLRSQNLFDPNWQLPDAYSGGVIDRISDPRGADIGQLAEALDAAVHYRTFALPRRPAGGGF